MNRFSKPWRDDDENLADKMTEFREAKAYEDLVETQDNCPHIKIRMGYCIHCKKLMDKPTETKK